MILRTDAPIDSIETSDVSYEEVYNEKYTDTVYFHYNKKIIDQYYFGCYTNKKKITTQIWLAPGNA
ncbi:MAG TPA: hypothetical protein VK666_01975 [Chryseolinea sp.]|nr:hypothetical protein [Chryseolinea sp.]